MNNNKITHFDEPYLYEIQPFTTIQNYSKKD